jgi:hypothetical protein
MKEYEVKVKIDVPAEKAIAALTTKEYAEREAHADGAFTAKSIAEKTGAASVRITTERTDPSRSPNGKKDMNKKEKSTVTSEWDTASMRSKWHTKIPGAMEKLVKIYGTSWLAAEGDCCTYHEKGAVSIGVPFIGGIIEKAIVADLVKNFPLKKEIIEKMV